MGEEIDQRDSCGGHAITPAAARQSLRGCRRKHSSLSSESSGSFAHRIHLTWSDRRPQNKTLLAVWHILEEPESGLAGRCFALAMDLLVMVSTVFALAQTMEDPFISQSLALVLNFVFDSIFTLEIFARFIVSPNHCGFFLKHSNIIDLAVMPILAMRIADTLVPDAFYLDVALLYFLPFLRLLKLLRRFEKFHLLLSAFTLAFEALPVLLYTLAVIVLFFSALIYAVEPRSGIASYPQAVWLTIVTVGTVGYGDVVPTTTIGNAVVASMIIGSAMYMAIPIGIVGGSFSHVWQNRDRLLLMHRTKTKLIQCGFTAQDITELFYVFDEDADGVLDLKEFKDMIFEMGLGISEDRVLQLFKTFDSDGTGNIYDWEFVHTLYPTEYAKIYSDLRDSDSASRRDNSDSARRRENSARRRETVSFRGDSMSTKG